MAGAEKKRKRTKKSIAKVVVQEGNPQENEKPDVSRCARLKPEPVTTREGN